MPIMTAYYSNNFIGYPFESISRPVFSSHNSCTLWKYSALHFISFYFSSSLILAPLPGHIFDLPFVFYFDDFDFEVAPDVGFPRFFKPHLYLFFFLEHPTLLIGAFLPKKLLVGFLPTAASEFFFTCAVFFGCLLIPPASNLPIFALVLVV